MSFWPALGNDLKIVGKSVLAIAPLAGEVISIVNPPLGMLIIGIGGRISSAIADAEQTITEAKQGQLKSQAVIADFQTALQIAQQITGKNISYDPVALQAAIDAQVAALNAFAALKGSIKTQ